MTLRRNVVNQMLTSGRVDGPERQYASASVRTPVLVSVLFSRLDHQLKRSFPPLNSGPQFTLGAGMGANHAV